MKVKLESLILEGSSQKIALYKIDSNSFGMGIEGSDPEGHFVFNSEEAPILIQALLDITETDLKRP